MLDKQIQSELITLLKDAEKNAECTIWIDKLETLHDRVFKIYRDGGGCMKTLHENFPEHVLLTEVEAA